MKSLVNERFLISPFLVFFLIHTSQISVGILKFQRDIIRNAGYDAWISVILTGFSINAILWVIYRILKTADNDIIHINQFCFGKWIGNLFNLAVILYFLSSALIVLRTYIEVVQVWMFPLVRTWEINIIVLPLIYYIISGGFRIVTGICFWGTVLPFIILFPILLFPLQLAHFNNLLPILNHSFKEIALSSKDMVFQYLGFESLLMFYPFIKNPETSQKWSQFSALFTIFIYLVVTIVTFAYFTEGQLKHVIWPTLTMDKIAEIPFIERFEYIIISFWFLVVLPAMSISLWSVCRGVKRLLNVNQRASLLFFLLLIFLLSNLMNDRRIIKQIIDTFSNVGLYFIYFYIPLLFFVIYFKKMIIKKSSL